MTYHNPGKGGMQPSSDNYHGPDSDAYAGRMARRSGGGTFHDAPKTDVPDDVMRNERLYNRAKAVSLKKKKKPHFAGFKASYRDAGDALAGAPEDIF